MHTRSKLKLYFFICLVMVAFAANSLLCREALASGLIGAADFTVARMLSGAATLWFLVIVMTGRYRLGGNWFSAMALLGYAVCFSLAYTTLSAGTGALLLFGAVQISMICWGLVNGERFPLLKWLGLLSAFAGLVWFVFPGVQAPPLGGAFLMLIGGLFWGVYSLLGRGAKNPTVDTAGNFVRAAPFALLLYFLPAHDAISASSVGWILAIASGALASGLGYALWYWVLPRLTAGTSATLQLSVPIIASVGGVVFLGEPLTSRLIVASAVILSGILLFIHSERAA